MSGIALLMGIAGSVLLWSGIKNASVADTVRSMIRAQPVPSGPSGIDAARASVATSKVGGFEPTARGTATGAAVASMARSFIGTPYRWGGHAPGGFDCSGLVSYCLTGNGVTIPVRPHTVAARFYVWTGAQDIDPDKCAPGDLVCWPSHIGIATGRNTMIHAPTFGQKVREQDIWRTPSPIVRRPKAYSGVSQ